MRHRHKHTHTQNVLSHSLHEFLRLLFGVCFARLKWDINPKKEKINGFSVSTAAAVAVTVAVEIIYFIILINHVSFNSERQKTQTNTHTHSASPQKGWAAEHSDAHKKLIRSQKWCAHAWGIAHRKTYHNCNHVLCSVFFQSESATFEKAQHTKKWYRSKWIINFQATEKKAQLSSSLIHNGCWCVFVSTRFAAAGTCDGIKWDAWWLFCW